MKTCPTKLYTNVYNSIIYNTQKWKQPKCPLVDDWINKKWYVQPMEYHLAIKRNGILVPTSWMNLENIVLHETSQSQKIICCILFHIYEISQNRHT